MMSSESVITPQMRRLVGVETAPYTIAVEAGDLRRFAEAIGQGAPPVRNVDQANAIHAGGAVALPTFFCPDPIIAAELCGLVRPRPFQYSIDGGSEWEFHRGVRAGDTLRLSSRIAELYEKQGSAKTGAMLFTVIEVRCLNQRDELVGVARGTAIVYKGAQARDEQEQA
jgi:acyl dehydratase